MKSMKWKSPVLIFALLGFCLSFGAPLGFYIHDYLVSPKGHNIFEHISFIHQTNFSTILYIGLGTNFFFTLFGGIAGYFAKQLLLGQSRLVHSQKSNKFLSESKNQLVSHFLNYMRVPTSNGLEYLMLLKKGYLPAEDKEKLLDETISQLSKLDKSLREIIDLQNLKKESFKQLSILELKKVINDASEKHDVKFVDDDFSHVNFTNQMALNPMLFLMNLEIFFEWLAGEQNLPKDIHVESSYSENFDKLFTDPNILDLISEYSEVVKITFNVLKAPSEMIDNQMFFEFLSQNKGLFYIEGTKLVFLFPVQEKTERKAA